MSENSSAHVRSGHQPRSQMHSSPSFLVKYANLDLMYIYINTYPVILYTCMCIYIYIYMYIYIYVSMYVYVYDVGQMIGFSKQSCSLT